MTSLEVVRHIRSYQQPLHRYMVNGGKRAIEVAHRRWGKDEIALDVACELAHKRPATYWHCLPQYGQARKALWTAVNPHTGKRRIDEAFPLAVREKTLENEMFIQFKCGSTWQLIGSDRYDVTVGAGPAGIVYSEWALANPSAWAYHRPMLEENAGWAMFITTPRGKNHAHAMYERAQKTHGWFAEVSTVLDTKALTTEQLAEALAEYQDLYGPDMGQAYFDQEYLCSFNAAIPGAFYGSEMNLLIKAGRVTTVQHQEGLPVYTAWDIGRTDDTSIWWYQVIGGEIHAIDFYSMPGADPNEAASQILGRRVYINFVRDKLGVELGELLPELAHRRAYQYGKHYLPHDARAATFAAHGKTVIEQLAAVLGIANMAIVPSLSVQEGIQAARQALRRCWFDEARCENGVQALQQYRREWDDEKKVFRQTPLHDWSSNPADAFRMLAIAWRQEPDKPKIDNSPRVLLVGPENLVTMNDMWEMARQQSRSRRI